MKAHDLFEYIESFEDIEVEDDDDRRAVLKLIQSLAFASQLSTRTQPKASKCKDCGKVAVHTSRDGTYTHCFGCGGQESVG